MKILCIMGGFLPGKKYGGPPVSVNNFCELIKNRVDCYVVTHNHDKGDIEAYPDIKSDWNNRGNVKVLYLADKDYCAETFEEVIIEIRPNYLYLQGLFQTCIYPCLKLAKKHRIKVVLAPRGELCSGAFHKKYKKLPYIAYLRVSGLLRSVAFQSTSEEETLAIRKYLGVPEKRIHFLTNIPSIPSNLPQRQYKKAGVGHFVFISRILWKKNLLMAIRLLNDIKGDVVFDIYGPKEDESYWKECENSISGLPLNINVNYCGVLSHDEIHSRFCKYDAFLFPTLSENFGHVIAEALFTGCIPIISDQTPWNDMNEDEAGWALPLSDENLFRKAIQEVVDMDNNTICNKRHNIKRYLSNKLNLEKLKDEYLDMFK